MREYCNSFSATPCTAAQDLATVYFQNNGYGEVTRISLYGVDVALPTAQQLELQCQVITGATIGSGGSTNAAVPLDDGDSAAGSSCAQNNTTPTSGTAKTVWSGGMYAYQGLDVIFDQPIPYNSVGANTAFVFQMLSTPSGTITLSGAIYFTERGLTGS